VDEDKARTVPDVATVLGPMFEATRMPAFVLCVTGEIVAANGAALRKYGYSEAEFQSMRIHDLVVDGRDISAELTAYVRDASVMLTRRPHRTKAGATISVLPSVFPIVAGGETFLVSLLQDVTSLDVAEEDAKKARLSAASLEAEAATLQARANALRTELLAESRLATIGRLSAGIAHEVNNPATLVMLNLGSLKRRLMGGQAQPDQALAMIDDCLLAMERIRDIVSDVKGLAGNRATEKIDLSALAAGVIRLTRLGVHKGASVDADLAPRVFAEVHGSRLSQVVTNLLLNAVEATPESDAHIELRTFRSGDTACIEVSDHGPGVPEHLRERIFEPFFTTRAGSGGTGLGLWLARGIVEEEGGTLAVASRPAGGAVFRVSLPAAEG
jgi:PAS domain S-box-containing protein